MRKSVVALAIASIFVLAIVGALIKDRTLASGEYIDVKFDTGDASPASLKNIKINMKLSGKVLYKARIAFETDAPVTLQISMKVADNLRFYLEENVQGYLDFETSPLFTSDERVALQLYVYVDGVLRADLSTGLTFTNNLFLSFRYNSETNTLGYSQPITEYQYTERGEQVSPYAIGLSFLQKKFGWTNLVPFEINFGYWLDRSWYWFFGWGGGQYVVFDLPEDTYAVRLPINTTWYSVSVYVDGTFLTTISTGWRWKWITLSIPEGAKQLKLCGHHFFLQKQYLTAYWSSIVTILTLPELENFHMTGDEWSLNWNFILKTEDDIEDPLHEIYITPEQVEQILENPILRVTNLSASSSPLTIERLRISVTYSNVTKSTEW